MRTQRYKKAEFKSHMFKPGKFIVTHFGRDQYLVKVKEIPRKDGKPHRGYPERGTGTSEKFVHRDQPLDSVPQEVRQDWVDLSVIPAHHGFPLRGTAEERSKAEEFVKAMRAEQVEYSCGCRRLKDKLLCPTHLRS